MTAPAHDTLWVPSMRLIVGMIGLWAVYTATVIGIDHCLMLIRAYLTGFAAWTPAGVLLLT